MFSESNEHKSPSTSEQDTTTVDAWFIAFAQHTVDRMLQRYGIASAETAQDEPPMDMAA